MQDATTTTRSFGELGVDADLVDALADAGITSPFPIQELTLPLALSGADVIGQARTGTGKTLAFGLPLLQRVDSAKRRLRRKGPPVQALVIVPTRELCLQVRDDLAQAGAKRGVEVVAAFGGRAIEPQIEALRAGVPVVVGTPGRLLDLTNRGVLDLSSVTTLVLDEADEMLDLGFLPDVERLIEQTAAERQTMLFSATMPAPVVALARRYMRKPTFLRAEVEEAHVGPKTRQHFFSCHRMDKPAVLARILQSPSRGLCVVFVRTKRMADVLANDLRDRGIDAAPIHSDLRQEARERALSRFRQGKVSVLVATEVAARGLDIDDVTHVVNYDCPDDEKMYLHRIGRTGRAGAEGVAVTLAVWNELARLEMIKRALSIEEETHEVFSTSPILDDLFDLPPRDGDRPAPSKADWQRAVRRGERGAAKPDEAAPAPRDDEAPSAPRVRRRTRSRAAEPSRPAPAPAKPASDEDGRTRRRVRQRPARDATAGDGKPRQRDDRDNRRPDGSRKAESSTSTAQKSRKRSGGRGKGSGSASRQRDARSTGRDGRPAARDGRSTARVKPDRQAARGDGRPMLRRPLEVTHLP